MIILKNIPVSINKRLSKISANEEVFNTAAPLYQAELDRNGYMHTLRYDPAANTNRRRKRTRKVIYFNPPYSTNVKTPIGERFLRLLDKHFPPGTPLHPLLNRRKVKISYRCLPNFKAALAKHNFKVLNQNSIAPHPKCNCLEPTNCPLPGRCTTPNLVYRATVTTNSSVEKYVGLTANTFKERYGQHKQDLSKSDSRTSTTLAGHVWELKDSKTDFQIKWEVVCRAAPFSPISKACNLCTAEKWNILFNPENATLNKRLEIFNHCRHKERMLIVKKVRRLRNPGS